MAILGKYNTLEIVKEVSFGLYLDGGPDGEILLPRKYVPDAYEIGQEIEVFIYLDSEDRLIATTQRPYATVGEFALLRVESVGAVGAFLNWGLAKDLLVPFREQKVKMEEGRSYLVYLYVDDETRRIVASAKLDKFLDNVPADYKPNEEVDLMIEKETNLGYKVIINDRHSGLIYRNEVFQPLKRGDYVKGYIKAVRPDEKIDVTLQPMGYEKIDVFAAEILERLKDSGGFLPVNDKSSADLIVAQFACSKKNFKKAIGALYRNRMITIEEDGIHLV